MKILVLIIFVLSQHHGDEQKQVKPYLVCFAFLLIRKGRLSPTKTHRQYVLTGSVIFTLPNDYKSGLNSFWLHLHFEVTDSTTAHLKHARKICLSSWVFFVCFLFLRRRGKKGHYVVFCLNLIWLCLMQKGSWIGFCSTECWSIESPKVWGLDFRVYRS